VKDNDHAIPCERGLVVRRQNAAKEGYHGNHFGRPFVTVTFVHCGQTVGWIKMKLGTQVGLCPSHIVLDAGPAPPPLKGHSPQFSAHICCGQMDRWIKMPLGMEVGLSLGDIVLAGEPAPRP